MKTTIISATIAAVVAFAGGYLLASENSDSAPAHMEESSAPAAHLAASNPMTPSEPTPSDSMEVPLSSVKDKIIAYAETWNKIDTSHNMIPIDDRISECGAIDPIYKYTPTIAFQIEYGDIQQAFGIEARAAHSYGRIRAYLGLDGARMHLYMTPIDSDGKDHFLGGAEPYLLDLTCPCPNTCDPSSVLYTTFMDALDSKRSPSHPHEASPKGA